MRTMQKKCKCRWNDKFYVIDFNNIKIDKDKIIKDKDKKNKIKILIKYLLLF